MGDRKFFCEGNFENGDSGHPGIYLFVPENERNVSCPYCSKEFAIEPKG